MGVAAAVLALLLATAIRQTTYWRDSVTLWTHSFGCTDDNALTRFTLGDALDEQGRTGEAIAEYREALRFNPAYVDAHVNLGLALDKLGRTRKPSRNIEKPRESIPVTVQIPTSTSATPWPGKYDRGSHRRISRSVADQSRYS